MLSQAALSLTDQAQTKENGPFAESVFSGKTAPSFTGHTKKSGCFSTYANKAPGPLCVVIDSLLLSAKTTNTRQLTEAVCSNPLKSMTSDSGNMRWHGFLEAYAKKTSQSCFGTAQCTRDSEIVRTSFLWGALTHSAVAIFGCLVALPIPFGQPLV
eukprot:gnl/TRDRNA2_/TRDRNA2_176671_c1_seq1.p1 gnl/TRDRNA2_/TRDRNA2_176671_c1~~gnl/TRDRNA2_/TRDRNA2_176671_c1_seq1.p1  ORF type:complete len:156 (-),score=7.00 gnl/TRDRNA2_/TRDRNA2_176671_c1_seq1:149-616(-)